MLINTEATKQDVFLFSSSDKPQVVDTSDFDYIWVSFSPTPPGAHRRDKSVFKKVYESWLTHLHIKSLKRQQKVGRQGKTRSSK